MTIVRTVYAVSKTTLVLVHYYGTKVRNPGGKREFPPVKHLSQNFTSLIVCWEEGIALVVLILLFDP